NCNVHKIIVVNEKEVNAMCRYRSYHKCSCQKCRKSYQKESHAHCRKATRPNAKIYDHYYEPKVSCKPSNPWLNEPYCDGKPSYQKKNTMNKCNCHSCKQHKQRKQYVCQCYEK